MGLLAERWNTRNDSGWLTRDDDVDGYQGRKTVAGVAVSRATALGLSAVFRCWYILSTSVGQAPRDVVVKIGAKSFPEYNPPAWLDQPNPSDPSMTGNDHFEQVVTSLVSDGNFFTVVLPHVLDPQILLIQDPTRVTVQPGPLYEIKDERGIVVRTYGPMQMLHGTWGVRFPGALRAVNPLEALRVAFGAAQATQDHAARFFGQGASLSFGVEVPGALDDTKKDRLRSALRRKYAGLANSHAIGVLTDGAKFVSGLTPTPEQAQFIQTRKFGKEEIATIYGVPPGLLGSQEPGASSYASAGVYDKQYKERSVMPLASTIESQYNRLLSLPPNLSVGTVGMKFNLDNVFRMDLLSRYQAYESGVRWGIDTPNENRALEDKAPLEGGDFLYMLQQMVPLGELGKTKATEPLDTQPAPVAPPAGG